MAVEDMKLADFSVLKELKNSHTDCKEFGINPDSRLWKPVKVGNQVLSHRIALAPLTRMRATDSVPQEIMIEYYAQRATNGGLLVSEATFIAEEAGGYPNAPGIYTEEHIQQWKKITDAVHAKGGIIYCQLWNIGHHNSGEMPNIRVISSGTVPFSKTSKVPEQMSLEDIDRFLGHYKHAAECAIKAGFDGCEVHGAHGYLLEQFLNPKINSTRNDIYSGPIENRARFMLEALKVVADTIGQERTAIRISPFSPYGGAHQIDPFEHWIYVCEQIVVQCPRLAYVSVTDPRLDNEAQKWSSDKFRAIFRGFKGEISEYATGEGSITFPEPNEEYPTVFFCAGGYKASDAEPCSDRTGDIISYGRYYISNPDLVERLKNGLELNPYDRHTFYGSGAQGYIDQPFADENTKKFVPISKKDPTAVLIEFQAHIDKLDSTVSTLKTEKNESKKTIEKLTKENLDQKEALQKVEQKLAAMEASKLIDEFTKENVEQKLTIERLEQQIKELSKSKFKRFFCSLSF